MPPLYPVGPAADTPGVTNPDALGPLSAGGAASVAGASGRVSASDTEHPLRPLVAEWVSKIRIAEDFKREKFGAYAAECMQFFSGPYDFLYEKKASADREADEEDMPAPSFKMTVNKVAEAVQIFGPVLYHRNPNRLVTPRELPQFPPEVFGDPMDPGAAMMAQQAQMSQMQYMMLDKLRAVLLQHYLNWTPVELKLKDHSRRAIDESIIKGMGVLWTELYTPPGLPAQPDPANPMAAPHKLQMAGTFQESVDHLLIDPDCESLDDAKWIARRCIHPAWEVENQYGLAPGTLRGFCESAQRASEMDASEDGTHLRATGNSADLVSYWKIYSKMGVGGRLQGIGDSQRQVLDQFGDYCYLVVVDGLPYPINLPPALINATDPGAAEEILRRLDWPTPFWADDDWPVTPIQFHEVPRCPWPMSHFKPAMGELKFLNWAYSFLAGKIRTTCRDFLVAQGQLDDEFKEAILHGKDLTLLELKKSHGGTIDQVIQFLQHPAINGDVWKVIEAVTANFEKRTGLTELVYGESASSYRSAEEAQLKGSQLQIRPDDMAQKVEDAMTLVARKEAICARWHLTGRDIEPAMGPVAAHFWDSAVKTQDLFAMSKQLEYRVEAGSAKKPNKQRNADNMKEAMQTLFQPLFEYASQTGNVVPVNTLIVDWARSIDLKAEGYVLAVPPPPPAPPVGGPEGPPGEGGGGEGTGSEQEPKRAA